MQVAANRVTAVSVGGEMVVAAKSGRSRVAAFRHLKAVVTKASTPNPAMLIAMTQLQSRAKEKGAPESLLPVNPGCRRD
jgi:trans-2-enoyl-CoA reductase